MAESKPSTREASTGGQLGRAGEPLLSTFPVLTHHFRLCFSTFSVFDFICFRLSAFDFLCFQLSAFNLLFRFVLGDLLFGLCLCSTIFVRFVCSTSCLDRCCICCLDLFRVRLSTFDFCVRLIASTCCLLNFCFSTLSVFDYLVSTLLFDLSFRIFVL